MFYPVTPAKLLHVMPIRQMIVATARHLGAVLITDDQLLLDYAATGHLKVMKAGR